MTAAAEEDPGQEGPQDIGTEVDVVGSIDESEKAFHSAERRIAELLKSEWSTVRPLRESPQHGCAHPTPSWTARRRSSKACAKEPDSTRSRTP